jgi:hypothetical protein
LVQVQAIASGEYAEANRRLAEIELADPDIEVVLLEAASIEDLKRTHGRYFENLGGPVLEAAS